MNIIEVENLSFKYTRYDETGQTILTYEALDNVSFSVEKGSFVAVLGHNGSGKSTLAKLINGLLKPSGGKITVNGYDTANEDDIYKIRSCAGMVFQNPDNQIIATVVEEDVAFGPENLQIPSEEIRIRVDKALHSVGMEDYAKHAPHFLSGGQKQRIAIAGVLAMEPEIIILDEPTAMLDPIGRKDVMETVKMLNKEKNITVLFITHYMDEAVQADRVIVMDSGSIAWDEKPAKIFSDIDKLKRLSLDAPQITELSFLLKNEGFDIPEGILSIEEMADVLCQLKSKI